MIITKTPLRMSFIGGGSDLKSYYQHTPGRVISTAINKYIYITVKKRFDDRIRVSYSKTEIVSSVDEIEHHIIREALKMVGIKKGMEVVFIGDIPSEGTGLGSSSSFAVGLLNALYAYLGRCSSAEKLAQDACRLEIDILKHPIGKQDQYAAAYGGFNSIQFNPDESVFVNPIIISNSLKGQLRGSLLLFYTGIVRRSSDILNEQNKQEKQNISHLDFLVSLAEDMQGSFMRHEISPLGKALDKCWKTKKKLARNVTNEKIDEYYKKAMHAGAEGGKILGAGGGGFLLVFARKKFHKNIRKELSELRETSFDFESQGSKVIYVHH